MCQISLRFTERHEVSADLLRSQIFAMFSWPVFGSILCKDGKVSKGKKATFLLEPRPCGHPSKYDMNCAPQRSPSVLSSQICSATSHLGNAELGLLPNAMHMLDGFVSINHSRSLETYEGEAAPLSIPAVLSSTSRNTSPFHAFFPEDIASLWKPEAHLRFIRPSIHHLRISKMTWCKHSHLEHVQNQQILPSRPVKAVQLTALNLQ